MGQQLWLALATHFTMKMWGEGQKKTHVINVEVHTNSGRICPNNHSWWSHIVYMLLKTIGWLKLSFRNWAILSMFIPFCKLFTRKRKMVFSWCCFLLKEKMPSPFFCNRALVPSPVPCRLRRVDLNEVWLGHYQLSSAIPLRNAKLILSADIWICPVRCIYTEAVQQCLWFPRACSTAIWNCYWLRIAR